MAHHTIVDAQGTAITTIAPSMLTPLPGCISSVERAIRLAGDDPVALLDASGKLHTSEQTALLRLDSDGAETFRWGVLWAQVACPSLAELWPLGSTSQNWGDVESSVTWMLAEGAGEGEGHVEILVPPSQRAIWRPLALVRASVVEVYLRDPGCEIHYVYKGTMHPGAAAMCTDAVGGSVTGGPRLWVPPPESWYTPPDDDGQSFRTTAIIRWLTSHAHASRASHAMLIASDAPWAPGGYSTGVYDANGNWQAGAEDEPDAWHPADTHLTTASECLHGRCTASLSSCSREEGCRAGWNAFGANQGRVPWNTTGVDQQLTRGREQSTLRPLVDCFATRCTCQARDERPHAVRFTGGEGLSGVEIASVFALAGSIGGAERRAFGLHEGGLSSPDVPYQPTETLEVAQGHSVTYLHAHFATQLPALHAKLLRLASRAHDSSGWALLDAASLSVRTIELLDYSRTHDSLGWHVDEQSSVTLLVMLSDPSTDFEGAQLQHEVRGQGQPVSATMVRGDVTVYRSHQAHRVTPLTSGRRRVMAIELWHDRGEGSSHHDGATGKRPHRRYGQCPAWHSGFVPRRYEA